MAPMDVPGFALFDTVIGRCAVAWSDAGLIGVQLPEANDEIAGRRLAKRFPKAVPAPPPPAIETAISRIAAGIAVGQARTSAAAAAAAWIGIAAGVAVAAAAAAAPAPAARVGILTAVAVAALEGLGRFGEDGQCGAARDRAAGDTAEERAPAQLA
jgi:hypothetical protein